MSRNQNRISIRFPSQTLANFFLLNWVPVQAALSVRGVVALFAEVVLDLLVHRLHVFLHVARRIRCVQTRNAVGLSTRWIYNFSPTL